MTAYDRSRTVRVVYKVPELEDFVDVVKPDEVQDFIDMQDPDKVQEILVTTVYRYARTKGWVG